MVLNQSACVFALGYFLKTIRHTCNDFLSFTHVELYNIQGGWGGGGGRGWYVRAAQSMGLVHTYM